MNRLILGNLNGDDLIDKDNISDLHVYILFQHRPRAQTRHMTQSGTGDNRRRENIGARQAMHGTKLF